MFLSAALSIGSRRGLRVCSADSPTVYNRAEAELDLLSSPTTNLSRLPHPPSCPALAFIGFSGVSRFCLYLFFFILVVFFFSLFLFSPLTLHHGFYSPLPGPGLLPAAVK